jgi:3',5'-cyclic AMP phosphodiesterase CpdA
MKLQVMSDLHLEFGTTSIENAGADILILSGDIILAELIGKENHYGRDIEWFFDEVSSRFPEVIYVAGNHEFYRGAWYKTLDKLDELCAQYPNVHFLEDEEIVFDDVKFVGSTIWTDLNNNNVITHQVLTNSLNDFKLIRNDHREYARILPIEVWRRHQDSMNFIRSAVADHQGKKIVVVGHHSPSNLSTHPKYAGNVHMNGGYRNELDEFIMDNPQIKLWTHGHTHHCFDYMIGETRVICNPRGYCGSEHTNWNPNLIIEV